MYLTERRFYAIEEAFLSSNKEQRSCAQTRKTRLCMKRRRSVSIT